MTATELQTRRAELLHLYQYGTPEQRVQAAKDLEAMRAELEEARVRDAMERAPVRRRRWGRDGKAAALGRDA